MNTIEIAVNGEARRVPQGSTAQDLLATMDMGQRRVAVEVNLEIVPRSRYSEVHLQPGDRVEIVQAIGGG